MFLGVLCSRLFVWTCAVVVYLFYFFFFNDTATTEIYTLSLHDALPICSRCNGMWRPMDDIVSSLPMACTRRDRKSTRLNSSHSQISYAVFCLKKKKAHSHPRARDPLSHPRHRSPPRSAGYTATR